MGWLLVVNGCRQRWPQRSSDNFTVVYDGLQVIFPATHNGDTVAWRRLMEDARRRWWSTVVSSGQPLPISIYLFIN